jgi:hypothetical protein
LPETAGHRSPKGNYCSPNTLKHTNAITKGIVTKDARTRPESQSGLAGNDSIFFADMVVITAAVINDNNKMLRGSKSLMKSAE